MKNITKIVIVVIALVTMVLCAALTSCNMQMVDTNYKFDKAIISLPNGDVVEGPVDSWTDYEDSDQIQVKINGTTYYCHHSDVVLIKEAD